MIDYLCLAKTWRRLKVCQRDSRENIARYQFGRFKTLVQHAYDAIPMYRRHYDAHGFHPSHLRSFEDIEKVPTIKKDVIRGFSLEERTDERVSKRDVYRHRTSGSTGEPMEAWCNKTESLVQTLKLIRFFREWGYSPIYKTLRLWGGVEKLNKSIVQKVGLFRRVDVPIYENPSLAVDAVLSWRPDVLYGMRSSLEALSEELERRGERYAPRILVSCGESLTDYHRKLFIERYGCRTINNYGSQEIGSIAWECPDQEGSLHVEMETVLVSFKDVKDTPAGRIGSVVATNLENSTMPFIRYEHGDFVRIPEKQECQCGRSLTLLGEIFGRNDDVIEHNAKKYYWNFFYTYLVGLLYVKKYKVVQTKEGRIEFRVLLFQDTEEMRIRCITDINDLFQGIFSPLRVLFVEDFPLEKNMKFKVVEKEGRKTHKEPGEA